MTVGDLMRLLEEYSDDSYVEIPVWCECGDRGTGVIHNVEVLPSVIDRRDVVQLLPFDRAEQEA